MVGGLFNYTGKLEFCAHERWGEVCNIPQLWSLYNTKVVCSQLGFPEDGKVIAVPHLICCTLGFKPIRRRTHSYDNSFGISKKDAVIGGVQCVGTEPELIECFHASIGNHNCGRGQTTPHIIISCSGR